MKANKIIKQISKFFKRRKMLIKYSLTTNKILNDTHLAKIMWDDPEFMKWHRHIRSCEIRCYRRLKNLK